MESSIRFSFEFRTTKVRWAQTAARVRGWWKRADGTVDGENLIAEITSEGTLKAIPFPLERLPDELWQQCVPKLNDEGELERILDEEVERACSTFEPQLIARSDRTYNISHLGPTKPSQPASAWNMRGEFLNLKLDYAEAVTFLNKWGSWEFREYVFLPEIVDLQQAIRNALTSAPKEWFASSYSVPPPWHPSPKPPYFAIRTDKCEVALRLTVTLDLQRNAKFKICARHDCGMPFEVTSNHKREYCRPYCSHLESMRRGRKTTKSAFAT